MFPVILSGYKFEDFQFTFTLAAGITAADVGKAVARDNTVPGGVKLAGDGDEIFGRLEVVESRTQEGQLLGTVALKFMDKLPVANGEDITVGDALIGAGNGEVKAKETPAGWEKTIANSADDNSFVVAQLV